MHGKSELRAAMSPRAWGQLVGGIIAVAAGAAVFAMDTLGTSGVAIGSILFGVGVAMVLVVGVARCARLLADEDGLTYRSWRGTRRVTWKRLSSLQFKRNGRGGHPTHMVVVNDMGRKEMEIPVELFGRSRLYEWTGAIPARCSRREDLLGP